VVVYGQDHPAPRNTPAEDSTYLAAVRNFNEHDDSGEALEEAKSGFASVLSRNPKHAPSLAYLGLIALESNGLRTADSLFALSLASDSTCPEARVGRALWLRRRGMHQAGLEEIRRAVELAPGSVFALRELTTELLHHANSDVTEGEINEAMPHLRKLLEIDPNDRDAHHDLAQSYEQLKRWNEAALEYREVLRIGQLPEDMDVWVYMVHQDAARCFENSGNYKESVAELRLYLAAIKDMQADDESVREIEKKIGELENKSK
jgi:tetratricopeptide (TPR) repeat protein